MKAYDSCSYRNHTSLPYPINNRTLPYLGGHRPPPGSPLRILRPSKCVRRWAPPASSKWTCSCGEDYRTLVILIFLNTEPYHQDYRNFAIIQLDQVLEKKCTKISHSEKEGSIVALLSFIQHDEKSRKNGPWPWHTFLALPYQRPCRFPIPTVFY